MKGCSKWAEAVIDCALGKTPEPDLAAHVAVCADCREALQEGRAMAARMDEALYRSAAAAPALYGPECVMANVRGQNFRGQTDSRAWWRWAAVGSAVLAVLIAIAIGVRPAAHEVGVTAISTWRSPTEALLRPPVAAVWPARPQLGEGLFKMKPWGEIHAQ